MNDTFLDDLIAMAGEAKAALADYEEKRIKDAPFGAIQSVGTACLESQDKLNPELAEALGARRKPSFLKAVLHLAFLQSLDSRGGINIGVRQSLDVIERLTGELRNEMKEKDAASQSQSTDISLLAARIYVDTSRIADLRSLVNPRLDVTRLIRFLEELNHVSAGNCHMATAMLVRAITDHVPPVFGFRTFAEVANNYGNRPDSFKKAMTRLHTTLRDVADSHLHEPMRMKESIPTGIQVDLRIEVNTLVAEVVRLLSIPVS